MRITIYCFKQNTFQAILITDETQSYVVFTYMCGLMEWENTATIGYTANGDSFDNHDPSSDEIACVNSPDSDWSNVIYLLSEDDAEANQPPGTYIHVLVNSQQFTTHTHRANIHYSNEYLYSR